MQIGDMRGLGGLVLTLWHELKMKVNIYNVKVQPQHHCLLQLRIHTQLGVLTCLHSGPAACAVMH